MGFNDINANANQVDRNSRRKYFLPRMDMNYNFLIDGRNFYDQNISDDFKKYEELSKIMTGTGEDYATGSMISYDHWEKIIN